MFFNEEEKQLFCFEVVQSLDEKLSLQSQKDVWHMYVDGAARKNPGPAGAGLFITCNSVPVLKKGFFLGHRTNNQAEYIAFLLGVYHLKTVLGDQSAQTMCYSDSLVMVQQLNGRYRIVDQTLQKLFGIAKKYTHSMDLLIQHIPREQNVEADEAANWGIDQKIALPEAFLSIISFE